MAINLPERRLSASPQIKRRQIPIEQIIQLMGRNPVAESLPGIGQQISQAMVLAAEKKRQQAELAALGEVVGADPDAFSKLSPEGASLLARSLIDRRESPDSSSQIREMERMGGFQEGSLGADLNTARMMLQNKLIMERGQQVKPPQGYMFEGENRNLRAIPGGPAESKMIDKQRKLTLATETARQRADRVSSIIDDAVSRVGTTTAGVIGTGLARIPGTQAHDLQKIIQTVQANIGFDELNAMRQSSPTGGALGQVSERELSYLQSVLANLEQSQSPEQLRRNLLSAKEEIRKSWERVRAAAEMDYGNGSRLTPIQPQQQNQAQPAPSPRKASMRWNPQTGRVEPVQ